jgi:hypothetical protein
MDMEKDTAQGSPLQLKVEGLRTSTRVSQGGEDEIQSRRTVLHGILAATCALLVPVAFLRSTDVLAATDPATNTKKVSKASVSYQTKPNGEKKCGSCANFIASSHTCKRVQGKVSSVGWCGLWTPKA